MWTIQFDEDCADWFRSLTKTQTYEVAAAINVLSRAGPQLGRPHVDTVKGSAFPNMKELQVQIAGEPWRVLFAFDPTRTAILLVGGCKVGDKRWYKRHVPIADARYRRHFEGLAERG